MTEPFVATPGPGRRLLWAGLGAWVLALSGVGVWLAIVPPVVLRTQLTSLQFWSLELCVAIAIAGGARIARDAWRDLEWPDRLTMAALAVVALVLTMAVAPRTNRIFYDEQIYQGIARNLSDLKRAQMCNDGTVEYGQLQCWSAEYNKQPYAYPHVLSLAYRVVGVRPGVAHALNAATAAATVCAVYLLALLLFGDRLGARFAALLIALTPHQLIWSATAAVEPMASLAIVAALVGVVQACRSPGVLSLAGAAALTAWAVQFRPESLLMAGVVAILAWRRGGGAHVGAPRLVWAGLLTFLLLAVHVAHLFAVRNDGWGTSGARLSIEYLWPNLRVNGPFYLGDPRFPVAYTVLAVFGLAGRGWLVERVALLVYFFAFFGIDLLFYAGSYNYGADVRYSVLTYPPIAVLGGIGAARLVRWLSTWMGEAPARRAVTAGVLFQFLWYTPTVRATTEEAWAARADVAFAQAFASTLPANAYVLTQNPAMFHVWGVNAGQMSLATVNPRHVDYVGRRYAGGVYVHWNYWCNVADPIQRQYCETALGSVPSTLSREWHVRDQRFAFYRLSLPRQPR